MQVIDSIEYDDWVIRMATNRLSNRLVIHLPNIEDCRSMKFVKISLITLGCVSAISLGACSSSDTAPKTESTTTSPAPAAKVETTAKTEENHKEGDGHDHSKDKKDKHTGQVVQVGKYHVEFNPDPDKDATHLDTVLHGENDKQITDAKLTAQVQLPDGSSKTLPLAYNTGEKQYTASLPVTAAGDYKVVMQVDVKGEKFNSRFNFKK
jgi:hypothetical protein